MISRSRSSSRSRSRSRSSRGALRAAGGLLFAALVAFGTPPLVADAAHAQEAPDDGLVQIIDPNQAQGSGRVVLDDGHIDFGPTLNTGEWIIQIHDDTSQPSYWRMLSDVVATVSDLSMLTVPDDSAYSFLGIDPGREVWVIPQVRQPGVIWAGWNTQEPNVLDALRLGTTLRVLGVDGPGDVTVYLQSGNFGEPQPLWSTHQSFPQDSWIEVNTHTHANWVFSDPGIYLVEIEFSADLIDGTAVTARDTLRFAVGDDTDANSAFDVEFDERLIAIDADGADGADGAGPGSDGGMDSDGMDDSGAPSDQAAETAEGINLGVILSVVAGAVGLTLSIAITVIVVTSRRAKARARAARLSRTDQSEGAQS